MALVTTRRARYSGEPERRRRFVASGSGDGSEAMMIKERSGSWRWLLGCPFLLAERRLLACRWLAGVLLAGLALGCTPKVKPGLNLQVLVIGNAAPRERATRIDVVFDRSMVGNEALGQALTVDANTPFRLEPAVAGTLRWRED